MMLSSFQYTARSRLRKREEHRRRFSSTCIPPCKLSLNRRRGQAPKTKNPFQHARQNGFTHALAVFVTRPQAAIKSARQFLYSGWGAGFQGGKERQDSSYKMQGGKRGKIQDSSKGEGKRLDRHGLRPRDDDGGGYWNVDAGDISMKYVDKNKKYRHMLLDVSMGRGKGLRTELQVGWLGLC